MQIRIQSTGQVVYEGEFRALFQSTSLPQQLTEDIINELGGDVVFEGAQATGGTVYQYSQADGVEQINGKWYTKYILGPVFTDTTAEDGTVTTAAQNEAAYKAGKDAEQAKAVRATRDDKLKETDWKVIKAAETSTSLASEWATYRQALRDVTAQSGFPWEVTWPTQPE
jgi:hypothetical protein